MLVIGSHLVLGMGSHFVEQGETLCVRYGESLHALREESVCVENGESLSAGCGESLYVELGESLCVWYGESLRPFCPSIERL